jgi:hypothetical protein
MHFARKYTPAALALLISSGAMVQGQTGQISMSMMPSSASLTAGQSAQFQATIRGTNVPLITWSMVPEIGTIALSNTTSTLEDGSATPVVNVTGVYTAPSAIDSPRAVTLMARSLADPTRAASATIFLESTVAIALTPSSVSLVAGQSTVFAASFGGTMNTSVNWSLDPPVGTITNGVYTAPASISTLQTIILTAASLADPSKTAQASIKLTPSQPLSITVNPSQITLQPLQTEQFTAVVQGGTGSVYWSINPSLGNISPSGLYTAPSGTTAAQTITVTASLSTEPPKTATAIVTLPGQTPPPPPTITLNVLSGTQVTRNLSLSASVGIPTGMGSSNVAAVEYLMDGKPLYIAGSPVDPVTTPPYNYTYPAQYLYNGYKTLTAVAKSAEGTVLATSAPITVQVTATAPYTVRFSGFDPSAMQSGTISWISTINASVSSNAHHCAIDGITVPTGDPEIDAELNLTGGGNPPVPAGTAVSFMIDTTRFSNGTHEFFCSHTVPDGATNSYVAWPSTASLSQLAMFNNGHTPMALRSEWQDMYLTTGQTGTLNPYIAYTDGLQDPPTTVGVTFTTDDPTIATVGSNGTVTAVAEGITYVHLAKGALVSRTRVIVDNVKQFLHFSKNGTSSIATSYTPGQSLFMRYMYWLSPNEMIVNPSTIGPAVQNAAINTLEGGMWSTTGRFSADTPSLPDYATWYQYYQSNILNSDFPTARSWNMALFATGDIAFRNVPQIYDFMHTSWVPQAWQTMLAGGRDSHLLLGIDMIDETNSVLGNYPKPLGNVNLNGPFTEIEVFGCPQTPCIGTGIVHYPFDTQQVGSYFNIQGSSVGALNGPHKVGGGTFWTSFVANPLSDTITVPNHGVTESGTPAHFGAGGSQYSLPGGLSSNTDYYLILIDANTLKVAASLANALAGIAIDITSSGSPSGIYITYGAAAAGPPFLTYTISDWTFTTQNVPNGVYNATTDPNLQIVSINPADWFQFAYTGKKIGFDGPSQIAIVSNSATVTWPNHGLSTGQIIQIKNASNANLDLRYPVTVINSSTLTFNTMNVPNSVVTSSTDPSLTVDIGYFPNWDNTIVPSIMSAANQVPNRTPISWPILGSSDTQTFQRWFGDPTVADYSSLYVPAADYPFDWGYRLYTLLNDDKAAIITNQPYIQRHQPKLLLVHAGSVEYIKQSAGAVFNPGFDKLSQPAYRAERVTASILLAAEAGMAGVRVYGYRPNSDSAELYQSAPIGSNLVQHVNPFVAPKKWLAMSNAFNFIKDVEPYILQPNISAPNLGPVVFTGAKEGNGGRLLMVTSFSEIPQTVNIDFTPYNYGNKITRYRVSAATYGGGIVISISPGETVTLDPGETVAYLFQP